MREDLGNYCRIFDRGDDLQAAAALGTWFDVDIEYSYLTGDGRCLSCDNRVNGRFEPFKGQFGRRRIPVRLSALR